MPALADRLREKSTFTLNGKEYQALDDDDVPIVSKTVQEAGRIQYVTGGEGQLETDQ